MSSKITRIQKKKAEQNRQDEAGKKIFVYIAIAVLLIMLVIYLVAR